MPNTITGVTEGSQITDIVEVIEVNIFRDEEVIVIEVEDRVTIDVADETITVISAD